MLGRQSKFLTISIFQEQSIIFLQLNVVLVCSLTSVIIVNRKCCAVILLMRMLLDVICLFVTERKCCETRFSDLPNLNYGVILCTY